MRTSLLAYAVVRSNDNRLPAGTTTETGIDHCDARVTRTELAPSTVGCGIPSLPNFQTSNIGPTTDVASPASFTCATAADDDPTRTTQARTTADLNVCTVASSAWSENRDEDRDGRRRERRIGDRARRLPSADEIGRAHV